MRDQFGNTARPHTTGMPSMRCWQGPGRRFSRAVPRAVSTAGWDVPAVLLMTVSTNMAKHGAS
jgi:hypothetical protein